MFKRKDPASPKLPRASARGERVEAEALRNPLLQQAFAVWKENKGTARFPTREAMTPRAMAPFLRNIVLVRVIDGGKEYEFRIVGDAIVQVQGLAFKGMTLAQIDEKLPGYGTGLRFVYNSLVAEGAPQGYRGSIEHDQSPIKRAFAHETILLPLGAGAAVDHILVVGTYDFMTDYSAEKPSS